MEEDGVPGDERTPVVPDDDRRFLAERVDQADHVGRQVMDVVVVDAGRLVALAVAAQVGRNRVKPCLGRRRQLVPPGVPGLGESVQEDDERALAHFGDPEA